MDIRKLNPELLKRVSKAREIKETHFPGQIFFSHPNATTAISMTGNECDLNCKHCGGKYLEKMVLLQDAERVITRNRSTSCLLSGGCTNNGSIDFDLESIKKITSELRVNAHVGLMNETEIRSLAPYVDCVSFDFIVDDETIQEVYNLNKTGQDYIQTYQNLRHYTRVIPHICIGLKGGEISGEYRAIDKLFQLGADGLVFIIFIPTRGTTYADHSPPALEQVIDLFIYAREKFIDIPINLGCMRPGGEYRANLDYFAILAGINKIVNPTPPALKLAEELGYQIILSEECCVL